ncbi:MAG TPA: hypothetical protein DCF72_07355, partial [Gammaproteobacteria bacterium]|nr:hypothetical protein [Gammaproteobacteria bacterium]
MTQVSLLKTTGLAILVSGLITVGCGKQGSTVSSEARSSENKKEIQNAGSDTMVNIAQAWAEAYGKANSTV